jgi:hypothetical protein
LLLEESREPRAGSSCSTAAPTSSSWIDQVERFFALLTARALKRGVFRSVADLEKAIMAYIEATNAVPKPFRWTKTADDIILASIQRFCFAHSPQTPSLQNRETSLPSSSFKQ